MIGMGNVGYLMIFSGCDGLLTSEAKASDNNSGTGSEAGSAISDYGTLVGLGVQNSWPLDDEPRQSITPDDLGTQQDDAWLRNSSNGGMTAEYPYVGMLDEGAYYSYETAAGAAKGEVPIWVVVLIGSWWNFGGAMQVLSHLRVECC